MQVKMYYKTDYLVQNDKKLDVIMKVFEQMDLQFLETLYSSHGRHSAVDATTMLQILIYAYSEGKTSSREIVKAMMTYDPRYLYLLDGQKAPSYATVNRFRQRLQPYTEVILRQFINLLITGNEIDLSSLYIDGTKLEANANRYTFVWKKSVLKYQEKLRLKIISALELPEDSTLESVEKALKKAQRACSKRCKGIVFVYGKGKRKSEAQKTYEKLNDWCEKLKTYRQHLAIMGKRNSYSKTDHDATFMRMKEDHMRNGQLKPAYNIQMATSGNYIVGTFGSHHPNDMWTLPLFVKKLYQQHDGLDKIVCDAGYHGLRAFIKPSNYEKSKTRRYQKERKWREALIYNEAEDSYTSNTGKVFHRLKDQIKTRPSGYTSISRVYKCFDWNGEKYKTKSIQFSDTFNQYRQQSLANILSDEGIDERVNRSIQAEGVFSKLKIGLNYHRFRHRGLSNVISEMNLMALAININVLTGKIKSGKLGITRYKKSA